ncbi:response regulator [Cylindrospermopsis raciborskii CHAB3438]|uniref:response regulator n=3 Tax=Cylindrospermopsis raciborskii TaxID=77022 RepID=UPI001F0CF5A7|nr:response regulator [Cylindrospermopsis raciborskii]MCH4905346.1 response regulator [Cylindrospermopsis raciborskii CHAB3438]
MKILIVDDDTSLCQLVKTSLVAHRYVVDIATDGEMGLEMGYQFNYDLILLDILMPKLDGLSLCHTLRDKGYQGQIIMVTAKTTQEDIIIGLDAGADDYLIKPYCIHELLARIRSCSRRIGAKSGLSILIHNKLSLNPELIEVKYDELSINLSRREFQLLELFLRHPQKIFTRGQIIDKLWSIDDSPTDGAVTNLVKDLRGKLKKAGTQEEVIETVHGLGYRLASKRELEQVETISTQTSSPITDSSIGEGLDLIEQVKTEFEISLPNKIANIRAELVKLETEITNAQRQQYLMRMTHSLSGSLGTLGYPQCSQLAAKMENILVKESLTNVDIQSIDSLIHALEWEVTQERGKADHDFSIFSDVPYMVHPQDFLAVLNREWQMLSSDGLPLSLIFCAIDNFDVNHVSQGIAKNSSNLRQIALVIRKYIYPPSCFTYYNQGSFGVLLPNMSLDATVRLAHDLHQTLVGTVEISLSLGITGTLPRSRSTVQKLLNTANQALIGAKRCGGNTFCLYPG